MENQNSATQTSYALCEWLNTLFAAYNKTSTPYAIAAYAIGLGDLSEPYLKLAFEQTLRSHRSSFAPTPGEIRDYLEAALENLSDEARRRLRGDSLTPDCPHCLGNGWTIVEMKEGNRVAVKCRCTIKRRAAASAMAKAS